MSRYFNVPKKVEQLIGCALHHYKTELVDLTILKEKLRKDINIEIDILDLLLKDLKFEFKNTKEK